MHFKFDVDMKRKSESGTREKEKGCMHVIAAEIFTKTYIEEAILLLLLCSSLVSVLALIARIRRMVNVTALNGISQCVCVEWRV